MRLHEVKTDNHKKVRVSFLSRFFNFGAAARPTLPMVKKKWGKKELLRNILSGCLVPTLLIFYYLIFGSYFQIKEIVVDGLGENNQSVVSQVKEYLSNSRFFGMREQSLLLFDTDDLTRLLEKRSDVLEVISVKEDWPSKVLIQLQPRTPTFKVEQDGKNKIFGEDGLYLFQNDLNDPASSGVPKLRWNAGLSGVISGENLNKDLAIKMSGLTRAVVQSGISNVLGIEVLPLVLLEKPQEKALEKIFGDETTTGDPLIQTNSLPRDIIYKQQDELSGELVLEAKSVLGTERSFYLLLQLKQNPDDLKSQLDLVLSKQSRDRLQKIVYLDMRYAGRGYLCLESTPCAEKLPWKVAE
jgi:hypothetical protein